MFRIKIFFLSAILSSAVSITSAQEIVGDNNVLLGAYYFDGWTGKTPHLSRQLQDSFPDRKPKWGWITSTPEIMSSQIDLAASSGINFFSFCWYFQQKAKGPYGDPKNQALHLFLEAPNKRKIKFNLLVANHNPYLLSPSNWNMAVNQWLSIFSDSAYLRINKMPLITFFSLKTLKDSFSTNDNIRNALTSFRQAATSKGFPGVVIAVCISPDANSAAEAKDCGFDIVTAYNDHNAGFALQRGTQIPIQQMLEADKKIWDGFRNSPLPYIPVATLNWDPRPTLDKYKNAPYYTGYSAASVYNAVKELLTWSTRYSSKYFTEKIALLYAWNEYGEGAWLTPSDNINPDLVSGIQKAKQQSK